MKKSITLLFILTLLLTACKQRPEDIITDEIVIETQSVTNETTELVTETKETISTNNEMIQTEEVKPDEAVESQTDIQLNETTEPVTKDIYTEEPEVEKIVKQTSIPKAEPETYVDETPNGYSGAVINPETGNTAQPGDSWEVEGWGEVYYGGDTTGQF